MLTITQDAPTIAPSSFSTPRTYSRARILSTWVHRLWSTPLFHVQYSTTLVTLPYPSNFHLNFSIAPHQPPYPSSTSKSLSAVSKSAQTLVTTSLPCPMVLHPRHPLYTSLPHRIVPVTPTAHCSAPSVFTNPVLTSRHNIHIFGFILPSPSPFNIRLLPLFGSAFHGLSRPCIIPIIAIQFEFKHNNLN